jgi:alanine dehydrogenase
MRVGVVKEIKPAEWRVALTPAGTAELVGGGSTVLVEKGAGEGSGFKDSAYLDAGALVVDDPAKIWADVDLLVKVKEPIEPEFPFLHEGLVLFTYLHLAADPALTAALVRSGATGVAYETVEDTNGHLPLLAPMSEIAGRLAGQVVAHYLTTPMGGRGILAGGAPGVAPARVLVLGGGVVGVYAARVARGLGAAVTILERSDQRLRYLDERFEGSVLPLMSDAHSVIEQLGSSDAVIGAVLVPGAGHALEHAQPLSDRGRSNRPGWVHRDVQANDARGTHLCRRRRPSLLRGQYARRGPGYFDAGTHKCHIALLAPPDRSWP